MVIQFHIWNSRVLTAKTVELLLLTSKQGQIFQWTSVHFSKCSILAAVISQLLKKLQQWSLYEGREDISCCSFWAIFGCWVISKTSLCVFGKNWNSDIFQYTQSCFAYISATKYRSKTVLYSKRTARYPLSPQINNNALAYLQAE